MSQDGNTLMLNQNDQQGLKMEVVPEKPKYFGMPEDAFIKHADETLMQLENMSESDLKELSSDEMRQLEDLMSTRQLLVDKYPLQDSTKQPTSKVQVPVDQAKAIYDEVSSMSEDDLNQLSDEDINQALGIVKTYKQYDEQIQSIKTEEDAKKLQDKQTFSKILDSVPDSWKDSFFRKGVKERYMPKPENAYEIVTDPSKTGFNKDLGILADIGKGVLRAPETLVEDIFHTGMVLAGLTNEDFKQAAEIGGERIKAKRAQDLPSTASRLSNEIAAYAVPFSATSAATAKAITKAVPAAANLPKTLGIISEGIGGALTGGLTSVDNKDTSAAVGAAMGMLFGWVGKGKDFNKPQSELAQSAVNLDVPISKGQLAQVGKPGVSAAPDNVAFKTANAQYEKVATHITDLTKEVANTVDDKLAAGLSSQLNGEKSIAYKQLYQTADDAYKGINADVGKNFEMLGKHLDSFGPSLLTNTPKAADDLIKNLPEGAEMPVLVGKTLNSLKDLKSSTFNDIWTIRKQIDELLPSIKQSTSVDLKSLYKPLETVRKSLSEDMKEIAARHGMADAFSTTNTMYIERVLPLRQILDPFSNKYNHATTVIQKALDASSASTSEAARTILKNLPEEGKREFGYALLEQALQKSVNSNGYVSIKKFNDIVTKKGSELALSLKPEHFQTLKDISTIVNAIPESTFKQGAQVMKPDISPNTLHWIVVGLGRMSNGEIGRKTLKKIAEQSTTNPDMFKYSLQQIGKSTFNAYINTKENIPEDEQNKKEAK